MARLPRIYIPGCSYHIVLRGNNREPCFYDQGVYDQGVRVLDFRLFAD